MLKRARDIAASVSRRLGLRRDWYLVVLAAGVGTVTAFGAIGFVWLLHTAEHEVGRLHEIAWYFLILAPVVGALATGLLVQLGTPEARGHGVPEIMDAVYRKGAKIRPRAAFVKSIASVTTIGSGGSAGAEGPIVQIGSAIGSGLAQLLRVPREQAATLLGCGAAAGIASVFNAPIAGIFFVLEILLRDFSLRTFTPIVIASVFSTAVTQWWYGENNAIFAVTGSLSDYEFTIPELPSYLVLGLLCGVLAVAFVRSLYLAEDLFARLRFPAMLKPVVGAALLGGLGVGVSGLAPAGTTVDHLPAFFGNGYESIKQLLEPTSFGREAADGLVGTGLLMLLLLLGCKALATCLTLGSGGSGGVFAPSLFLGATGGAAFGVVLDTLSLLPEGGSPAAYALVGMAAVVAGTTHAPLTAILILFELTRDVYVLLPIMLAAVFSTLAAQVLMRDSIYTLKLRRRGVLVGTAADLSILRRLTARSIAPTPHVEVHPDEPLSKLSSLRGHYHISDFVVTDHEGNYLGMVTGTDMRTALMEPEAIPYLLVEELLRRDLPTIHPEETLDTVLEKFSKHDVASLPLLAGGPSERKIAALVTRARLMRRYQEELTKG